MSKRELVDMGALRSVALQYLTQQEFESTLETTFGAIESMIQDRAPRGSKKATVTEFQEKLIASGAAKMGEPFSFLRAIAPKG
jgi:hypothetical protein